MKKIFVDGSAGTTGLRIFERLNKRDDVELITISEERRKDLASRKAAIESADAAFLCLPDDAAREIAEAVGNSGVKIIDTSTAHRTEPGWAYGFPELSVDFEKAVMTSDRIAVPGCHASGFISLVYPLVAAGIMPKDYPIVCYSVTGYSGGGKKMIAEYESKDRSTELSSPRQYGLAQKHKHLKEMTAICGLSQNPVFAPIVADYYSGMVVSVPVFTKLLNGSPTAKQLHELFCEHYKNQKIVKVNPLGADGFLGSNNLAGKDILEIEVTGNDERVLLAARFDNLGKGSSGAAVECMNMALGFERTMGLDL
ncbi:MAG: N-acetyl-gamma-glutamyl-phosphate reductase [Clostridiales bacterium]|nr:N-acetyl-gamma-glutamyl-phosphate reductase [Clostridiales bacterium]